MDRPLSLTNEPLLNCKWPQPHRTGTLLRDVEPLSILAYFGLHIVGKAQRAYSLANPSRDDPRALPAPKRARTDEIQFVTAHDLAALSVHHQ
jgi:hypothetical protein